MSSTPCARQAAARPIFSDVPTTGIDVPYQSIDQPIAIPVPLVHDLQTRFFRLVDQRVDAGRAVKVDEGRKHLPSLLEMRSELFIMPKPDEHHSIGYDLDGDGKKNLITATLWESWSRMMWTVRFANGKKFEAKTACKRIGVPPTKTNGINDLVCDQDAVLHWNGQTYQ